jgi:rsbT antagonist protein RsbS
MASQLDIPRVAIQVSRGIVIASVQIELDDAVLGQFREDLLGRIHQSGARGVIIDVTGLEILDAHEFGALRSIILMTGLLGAETVLVGLQPGIVSALVTIGADIEGLESAVDLDAAFALLEREPESDREIDAPFDTFDPFDPFDPEIPSSPGSDHPAEFEE